MKIKILSFLLVLMSVGLVAQKRILPLESFKYGANNNGTVIKLQFDKGKEHNHPLFAIWLADDKGRFIQTLYVSKSIGTGVFEHGKRQQGHWLSGELQRPAALPYWTHQRGILNEYGTYLPTPEHPELDAYTGATPQQSFVMYLKTEKPLQGKYKVMLEVNQSWDWNEFWYNNKYPDDKEYKTSSQPAVVYEAEIDTANPAAIVEMKAIGHSHYAGRDGSLSPDLSTLTTALSIAKSITVSLVD